MPTENDEQRDAQLIKLKKPIAMTLAKKPANRSGFKVIRNDDETQSETDTMAASRKRKKTVKRDESLYQITLPEGISRNEADSFLSQFAMEDDYEVFEDGGRFYLRRKEVNEDALFAASEFDMGNGFSAHIDPEAFAGTATRNDGAHGVKLVELQLDGYNEAQAQTWLEENGVDFKEGGVEVVDGGVIISRHDYDKADTRKVRIGEGVTGIVVRAEDNDVPVHLYRAVVEESYGYYGWGMLDFAQYLAAPYYADATWDGISALREVLENVTLYSGLPLDERKRLVDNALEQFGNYYKALIEAMPREAVAASQRFDRQNSQEATMPKQQKTNEKVDQRTDEQKAADAAAAATATAATDTEKRTDGDPTDTTTSDGGKGQRTDGDATPEYVTKTELTETVTAAVTAALKAREDKGAGGDEGGDAAAEEQRSDKPTKTDEKLAGAITTLADATKVILERMDGFDEKLDKYGESATARSDEDGGDGTSEGGESAKKDVFDGMMGSLSGIRS